MAPTTAQDDKKVTDLARRNKRFRKNLRITPWKDHWELENTGRGLLCVVNILDSEWSQEDNNRFLDAIDNVAVWKARSAATEELPHAIESTALLAQVFWRDQLAGRNYTSVSEIRLAYSSAIVRCINGFADSLQQQRFVAAPISALCSQLGIPSWLVDIRHDASHNALPTLPVLRLATTNLLQYLQSEYWMRTCPEMAPADAEQPTEGKNQVKGLDILLNYKTCAAKLAAENSTEKNSSLPQSNNTKTDTSRKRGRTTPVETTRPFDTFFGDSGGDTSSDEDDWEDPLLGSLWGNNMGSSNNRFSALEMSAKTKTSQLKKKKKPPKAKPVQQRKKQPGEKFPLDFARDFIKAMSPLEGSEAAIQFLVWGGIGGTTQGRGVLIPGSVTSFPATKQGVQRSWQRYLPLIEVCGLAWPGFCSALLVHLVDFVLSIEGNSAREQEEDAGAVRKLFFLSAWIRLLLSEKLVVRVCPGYKSTGTSQNGNKKRKGKRDASTDIALAEYQALVQLLGYPLNSLCDRCSAEVTSLEFRHTSQDIEASLVEILGDERVVFHGLPPAAIATEPAPAPPVEGPEPQPGKVPTVEPAAKGVATTGKEDVGHGPTLSDGKMSLDDMEALLLEHEDDHGPKDEEDEDMSDDDDIINSPADAVEPSDNELETEPSGPTVARPAWVKCQAWDPCALGTLPGQTG